MADISENNILNLHRDPSIRSVSGLHLQFLQRFKANNLIPQKILEGVHTTFPLPAGYHCHHPLGHWNGRAKVVEHQHAFPFDQRKIYLLLNLNVYISPISF